MAGGNSKANQHKSTQRKQKKGSRGRSYMAYLNEDRWWHNKLARLSAKINHAVNRNHAALEAHYRKIRSDVMSRAPIQVRSKY